MEQEQTQQQTHEKGQQKTSPDRFWKFATVALIVVLAVFAFRNTGSSPSAGPTGGTVANVPGQNAPAPVVDMKALVDDDAVLGSAKAPVTIVEFSDYQCPFCTRFYQDTEKQLYDTYIKTGKVKFIYRDFPLSFHQNAQKAAEGAECAGEQGKYFEMHDKMFSKSQADGTGIAVADLKTYAKELGLDTAKFNDCLDSGKMAAETQKDQSDGAAAGVQGTPSFFVNGVQVSGAQPFSVFQQVIDAALAKN